MDNTTYKTAAAEKMVFKRQWVEALKGLPDDLRLRVYEAAMEYSFYGSELGCGDAVVETAFRFIKADMDCENPEQYTPLKSGEKASERDREEKNGKQKESYKAKEEKGKRTKEKEEKEIYKEKEKEEKTQAIKELQLNQLQSEKASKGDVSPLRSETSLSSPQDGDDKVAGRTEAMVVLEYFNKKIQNTPIPGLANMRGTRLARTKARLSEYGGESVRTAIDKFAASRFLQGGGDKGWTACFDWFIRPNNFPKVLEGNYDNDKTGLTYGKEGGGKLQDRRGRTESTAVSPEDYEEAF